MQSDTVFYVKSHFSGGPAFLQVGHFAERIVTVPQYDLGAMLDRPVPPAGILLTMHADQVHLQRLAPLLERYVDGGGTLVVNGHVARPFLAELTPFVPVARQRPADLQLRRVTAHPVFTRIDPADLQSRKGVYGFYGRGANPPPEGATVIHELVGERAPVDWTITRPSGGRVFCHAGNDLWGVAERPETTARLMAQLLDWILAP